MSVAPDLIETATSAAAPSTAGAPPAAAAAGSGEGQAVEVSSDLSALLTSVGATD